MTARYIVRELTGYRTMLGGSDSKLTTEVMILDRDYCHEVVWSSWPGERSLFTDVDLIRARGYAHRLCRDWNESV